MASTLNELRSLYGGAGGGEMHDPAFRAVAEKTFVDDDRCKWLLVDSATFLSAPFRPDGLARGDFQGLGVADLIPLPELRETK